MMLGLAKCVSLTADGLAHTEATSANRVEDLSFSSRHKLHRSLNNRLRKPTSTQVKK
jgi:hypothetical protein